MLDFGRLEKIVSGTVKLVAEAEELRKPASTNQLPGEELLSRIGNTPLLRLDDRLAKMRVEAARADLKAAQAQVAKAKKAPEQQQAQVAAQTAAIQAKQEELGGARSLLKRAQELLEKKIINEAEVTAREAVVKQLEAAVRAEQAKLHTLELLDTAQEIARAEADVEAKQAQIKQAQLAVDECTLHAPEDGTILRIFVHNFLVDFVECFDVITCKRDRNQDDITLSPCNILANCVARLSSQPCRWSNLRLPA